MHSINWPGLALLVGKIIGCAAAVTVPWLLCYWYMLGLI